MLESPPLHDPAFWAGDPYPVFTSLRANDPVHRYDGPAGQMWVVSRHADVMAASKDPATFCSGKGVLLTDLKRPVVSADSVLYLDPPLHGKRRKLVSRSLTVRRVAALEERVRAIVVELLDALDPSATLDAVEALSMPLPLMVIAELVGVPRSDLPDFRRWSDAMIDAASEFTDEALVPAAGIACYPAHAGPRHRSRVKPRPHRGGDGRGLTSHVHLGPECRRHGASTEGRRRRTCPG